MRTWLILLDFVLAQGGLEMDLAATKMDLAAALAMT
jgi:hypothetical protein